MAKKSSPNAPGTYVSGGVRCTLDAPFDKASKGSQQNMGAPFNKPRVGGSELPTKIYDNMGGPKSTPGAGSASSSPSSQGPNRPGTKQNNVLSVAIRQPLTVELPAHLHSALASGFHVGMLQQPDELAQFLLWLEDRKVLPAKIIIEIGSHKGGTSMVWGALASDLVIAIDLPGGVGGGLTKDEVADRSILLHAAHPHVRFVLGNSAAMTTVWKVADILHGRKADLLFIDGDHRYDGVMADYMNYREYVRDGGVIAFHDLNDGPQAQGWDLGVTRLFADLEHEKFAFSIGAEWGGIGAVIV